MNSNIFKGNWNELKGKIKQRWGKLTDNDLTTVEGNFDELHGKLQKTYGYTADQAKAEVESFRNTFTNTGTGADQNMDRNVGQGQSPGMNTEIEPGHPDRNIETPTAGKKVG